MEAGKDTNKPDDGLEHITLRVLGEDRNEVLFRIRKNAKLCKLMHGYCVKVSANIDSFQFMFDGRRLRQEQTPYQAGLEDGDEIDAFSEKNISEFITVTVNGQDGSKVTYNIKRSAKLKELMQDYCDRLSMDIKYYAFLHDGRNLKEEDTPDDAEIGDGEEIAAMLHMTSG